MKYLKYKSVRAALFSCLAASLSQEAASGAWTLEPSRAQMILTGAYSSSNTFINGEGETLPLQNFTKNDSRIYLEFGLYENLMVFGQAGYQFIEFQGVGSEVSFAGFDETKLGFQYKIKESRNSAASVSGSYIADGGLDDPRLDLGGRNNEIEIKALYGRSGTNKPSKSLKLNWFYDFQIGTRYDLKSDNFSQWQVDLTLGAKPHEKWMGLIQFYGLNVKEQRNQGFIVPKSNHAKLELSLAYQIKPGQYIQFGALRTLAGRNVVKESGLFTGVWRKF
jgi:hypothetical protein